MRTPNVGIDIGTTTSVLATVGDGTTVPTGEWVCIPTVISFEGEHAIVGESARDRAVRTPIRTVRSFTSLLGTGERVSIVVDGQTREYTPEELTALVLTKLQRTAHATIEELSSFDRVVVTVPTTFTARQRRALCQACEIAGIDVARLMTGPTAAALTHGIQTETEGTILVYDLGGGGFDAALIDITEGVFDVLGTRGDQWLGGAAFDATIVEWLDLHLERKYDIHLEDDPVATERLFMAARTAKRELGTHTSTTITATIEHEGRRYEIRQPLHRNQLERRTRDLVSRTISVCEELLDATGRRERHLDGLLFVGGVTDLPFVRERITDRFERVENWQDASEAIALGGAMRAAIVDTTGSPTSTASMGFSPTETVVLDAAPHSLRLKPRSGITDRLVSTNTTLPQRATAVFTTTTDRQQYLVVPVYYDHVIKTSREKRNHQTEPSQSTDRTTTDRSMDDTATTTSERADDRQATHRLLDAFRIGPLRPRHAGDPSIEVTFEFDPDGIVHAHAIDLDAERDGTLETRAVYRHTETKIGTMKQELPTVR
ncbi:Hsp70 family protein [Halocatena salina]|uniref:Hsp70 family protein n=1 Tax=Halocatena salina TaxID=2934340 RepID=A0A8U0A2L3_9EURY|nr:Hsp70 family protein [Halocatena salina]UPM43096.1 Hsp70 family protein [Halocatena salina]